MGLRLSGLKARAFISHAHALLLPEHPECVGPHGALVIVPNSAYRGLPPDSRIKQVVKAINFFIHMAHTLAEKGPGTITDKLYWYRRWPIHRTAFPPVGE